MAGAVLFLRVLVVVTVTVTAAAASAFAGTVAAAEIENQTLRYAASYRDFDAGAVEIRIRADAGGYRVEVAAKPNALAKLLGADALTTVTQFARDANGAVMLDSGGSHSAGDDGDGDDNNARWFRIDRDAGRIEFSSGEPYAVADGAHVEAAAFPLLLMLRMQHGESIGGMRVLEVSARRARAYRYESPREASIDTPAGEFTAWQITRRRIDRPDDSVTVYLRKQSQGAPIPLKIAVTKRGRTSTLLLTAVEWES
ncbi:MAG: DUF3108 domain-containing protein [Gammaproteobacteria bacterium]|nr:DUF3108 domain-containing protein [Gammaproteobacteria bacterium]